MSVCTQWDDIKISTLSRTRNIACIVSLLGMAKESSYAICCHVCSSDCEPNILKYELIRVVVQRVAQACSEDFEICFLKVDRSGWHLQYGLTPTRTPTKHFTQPQNSLPPQATRCTFKLSH